MANLLRYLRPREYDKMKRGQARAGFGDIITGRRGQALNVLALGPDQSGIAAGFAAFESAGSVVDPHADGIAQWKARDDEVEIVVAINVYRRDVEPRGEPVKNCKGTRLGRTAQPNIDAVEETGDAIAAAAPNRDVEFMVSVEIGNDEWRRRS